MLDTPSKLNRQKVVRTNVTIHPVLWEKVRKIVTDRGFNGVSDYFQACIRKDAGLESGSVR